MCKELGIGGWVKNSKKGTIMGKMQGPKDEVDKMWVKENEENNITLVIVLYYLYHIKI